ADKADQRGRERNQSSRDRRRVHDRAGQDEQRDGEQRETRCAIVHFQRQIGQHMRPLDEEYRQHGDEAERHRDRHVQDRKADHADKHQRDGHRLASVPLTSGAPCDMASIVSVSMKPEPRASRSSLGSRSASAMTINTAPIGTADAVTRCGIHSRLTRLSLPRTTSTSKPVHASMMKKINTTASANSVAITRSFGGMALTKPGTPMCAPRKAASAEP